MKAYQLKIDEVDDLVPKIADALGCSYTSNFGEYALKLPGQLGTGEIRGVNFPNGIGLHIMDCDFKDDTQFTFINKHINSLRFIYCMKGEVAHKFSEDSEETVIHRAEHLIAASRYNENQSYIFKKESPIVLCYLEIDKVKFQQQLSYDLNKIDDAFYPLFADVNAMTQICTKGFYSLQISDIINEILTNEDDGLVRTNFFGAKALECVALMLKLYKEDSNGGSGKPTLRLSDMDNVAAAVQFIESHISELATIPEIADSVGIEAYKLQEGFKRTYGVTVNDYIKDYRLKRALTMLTSDDKNVSEVVYALGLSSRSYFSKIFKEKYGIAPSSLRKNPESI